VRHLTGIHPTGSNSHPGARAETLGRSEGRQLVTFEVGDSRCYLFRAGQLVQLSYDDVPDDEALGGSSFPPLHYRRAACTRRDLSDSSLHIREVDGLADIVSRIPSDHSRPRAPVPASDHFGSLRLFRCSGSVMGVSLPSEPYRMPCHWMSCRCLISGRPMGPVSHAIEIERGMLLLPIPLAKVGPTALDLILLEPSAARSRRVSSPA
jgi:hypothetical protein